MASFTVAGMVSHGHVSSVGKRRVEYAVHFWRLSYNANSFRMARHYLFSASCVVQIDHSLASFSPRSAIRSIFQKA